jgi:hypothetical protein
MRLATCARILLAAAALLAARSGWAEEFGGLRMVGATGYRMAAAPGAASRLNSRTADEEPKPQPEPETVAAPEAGDGDECCDTLGSRWGLLPRWGMWYGGVDYLLMRPRLSQGVSEVRRTLVTNDDVSPNTSTLTDESIEWPFTYQSAFRASLGYRLLDCGGDIQVTYWRMTSDARISDGPADTVNNTLVLAGQLKNNPGNGGFLSASTGITANIFDVDFAKCISLGGPQECDPCSCGCPRWDLRWWAGARIADISRFDNNLSTTPVGTAAPTDQITSGNIDARFVGAGPRVGMQGRRYFGGNGFLSLYARASQALLIGDYRMSRVTTTPGDAQVATQITEQFDRYSRMVPVTDIEVGGSWQIAPYTYLSVGYFFQCWLDLGQSETIVGTNFGPLDTSNILGFDGLVVRAELLF